MHKYNPIIPQRGLLGILRSPRKSNSGFSLVEVALAIAIVAFAFIALIGLLPTGLQVFRGSMNNANENWITQDINSMLQTTPWSAVDKMDAGNPDAVVFAYDDEGKLLEKIKSATISQGSAHESCQYVAKLLVEKMHRPNAVNDEMPDCRNATVLIAPFNNRKALAEFNSITSNTQLQAQGTVAQNSELRVRSFVLARMDAVN